MNRFSAAIFTMILMFSISAEAQVSEGGVDFEVKGISAGYQAAGAGEVSAFPWETQPDFKNPFEGVGFWSDHYDQKTGEKPWERGVSLASKFASAVRAQDSKSDLLPWLTGDGWGARIRPKAGSEAFEGNCHIWASWSVDPEIHALFQNLNDGLICSGIPFDKGELKELVTALRSDPAEGWNRNHTALFSKNTSSEEVNVALASLGLMSRGGLEPHELMAKAARAKQAGKAMMFDLDAGNQTWNHPVEKMNDRITGQVKDDDWKILSTAEMRVVGADQDYSNPKFRVLKYLRKIEDDLVLDLMDPSKASQQITEFCTVRKLMAGEGQAIDCSDLNRLSPVERVEKFQSLKKLAFENNFIAKAPGISVTRHSLDIQYTDEVAFRGIKSENSKSRSVSYVTITDASGKVLRSAWAPPAEKLSVICQGKPPALPNRVKTSLTPEISTESLQAQCSEFARTHQDHSLFTGTTPPQDVKVFNRSSGVACGSAGNTEQQKSYCKLLEFIRSCDPDKKFHQAAEFRKDLMAGARKNKIDVADLKARYAKLEDAIDLKPMVLPFVNVEQTLANLKTQPAAATIQAEKDKLIAGRVMTSVQTPGSPEFKSWTSSLSADQRLQLWNDLAAKEAQKVSSDSVFQNLATIKALPLNQLVFKVDGLSQLVQ